MIERSWAGHRTKVTALGPGTKSMKTFHFELSTGPGRPAILIKASPYRGPWVRQALVKKVEQWHVDRNLIDGASDKDQVLKLIQEMGELSDNVCKGNDIRDDLGDMLVVMINIMKRNNITMEECLAVAYMDIKDRKGRMIDGIFVKEGDT